VSNLLIGFILGAASGMFCGYGVAMICVRASRARRGWKRKV
jgi:hypothetical protein